MKNIALTLATLVLCGTAAFADLRVEGIVINQTAPIPSGTNIRVNLLNDGLVVESVQHLDLQARVGDSDWKTIKSFDLSEKVLAGDRLSVDYFPTADGYMDDTLTAPSYELRAVVSNASGATDSAQQSFTR